MRIFDQYGKPYKTDMERAIDVWMNTALDRARLKLEKAYQDKRLPLFTSPIMDRFGNPFVEEDKVKVLKFRRYHKFHED